MAAPVSDKISVIVVDGVLGALHRLGFPLSALVSMREAGAQLNDASWNIRNTASGLSVSLFWPCNPSSPNGAVAAKCINKSNVRLSKSKKRRLRRQKSKVAKSRVSSQKPTPG